MPRVTGKIQRFNFSKGWNTEANPMTFPENTAQDLDNVILDVDGAVRRRPGFDYDSQTTTFGSFVSSSLGSYAIGMSKWKNVAGSGSQEFIVTQYGLNLHFHRAAGTATVDNFVGSLDFSSQVISGQMNEARKDVVKVTSGLGYLFVVGQHINPFYITYASGTLSLTNIEMQIRDFEGLDDGLAIDERPNALSAAHQYNLRNQGWPESFDCAVNGASDATTDPVVFTETHLGVYPSNADIIHLGKVATGSDEDDIGRYDPKTLAKNIFGTTKAPRGKHILNAFDRDRTSFVSGVTNEYIDTRPRAVGFHNGRVFYSGLYSAGHTGEVFYSQQLTTVDHAGLCYQQNDPTAEEYNELLATDGGVISIPNAGNIVHLEESPTGLLVFASNGVWEITGENGKFSADNFFVRKVTDSGVLGEETVVNADGLFVYWGETGIVALQADPISNLMNAEIISKNTIQKGYISIGSSQRKTARGVYIREEKKCVWMYSTASDYDGVLNRFKYNGFLLFDLDLGAFYKYTVSDLPVSTAPYIAGIVELPGYSVTEVAESVTAGGDTVTVNGEVVTVSGEGFDTTTTISSTWKCLVVRPSQYGMTMGEFSSLSFTDWFLGDGTGASYSSYIETGYEFGGEAINNKQATYVHTYLSAKSKTQAGGYYGLGDIPDYSKFCGSLSDAVYVSSYDAFNEANTANGIAITNNDTMMYVADNTQDIILSYTIGELVEDAVLDGNTFDYSTDVGGADIVALHSEGNYLYALDDAHNLHRWDLTTPYDITTATSHVSIAAPAEVDMTGVYDFSLSQAGTAIHFVGPGRTNPVTVVATGVLTTPYDITTISYYPDTLLDSLDNPSGSFSTNFSLIGTLTSNYLIVAYDRLGTGGSHDGEGLRYYNLSDMSVHQDITLHAEAASTGPLAPYLTGVSNEHLGVIAGDGSNGFIAVYHLDDYANGDVHYFKFSEEGALEGYLYEATLPNHAAVNSGTFMDNYFIHLEESGTTAIIEWTGSSLIRRHTHSGGTGFGCVVGDGTHAVLAPSGTGFTVLDLNTYLYTNYAFNQGSVNMTRATYSKETGKVFFETPGYNEIWDFSDPTAPTYVKSVSYKVAQGSTNLHPIFNDNYVMGMEYGVFGDDVLHFLDADFETFLTCPRAKLPNAGTFLLGIYFPSPNNGYWVLGDEVDGVLRKYSMDSVGHQYNISDYSSGADMLFVDEAADVLYVNKSDEVIHSYTYGTSGDPLTLTGPSDQLDTSAIVDSANSLTWNSTGTSLYVVDDGTANPPSTIYQWDTDCT